MYSSDVTRTFPIHKKFSSPQKDIYNEVLKAQNLGIEGVVVGNSMKNLHEDTIKSLSESIVNLGLVPLGVEETNSMMHFFEFFIPIYFDYCTSISDGFGYPKTRNPGEKPDFYYTRPESEK